MALDVGTRLGSYEITAKIGAGGMGEVYRARDARLNREVAIKVLPEGVTTDPERRERFQREAEVVAALNHPNIVTIHSVEEAEGTRFLTMELVEGKPLSELVPRQGFPLDRILALAIPLADAVSAAHQRGITHRDLKPANVMVSEDGRLKVLDFGLAKLKEDETVLADGEGPTAALTGEGRILGTVAYMAPEQAEGQQVDHRADLFALGILLYELATGERPFKGDTNVSMMSAILKDTPPSVTDLNPALPRDLARMIRRCLAKDPERRYQSAKDLRNDLEELQQEVASGEVLVGGVPIPQDARQRRGLWPAALGVAGLAAIVAAYSAYSLLPREHVPVASETTPVDATYTQLTFQAGYESFPSLSPDGQWIVYDSVASGKRDIYLQSVGGQNPINLTEDSPGDDGQPVFSPDGNRIVFRSDRQGGGLFVMGRTGEFPRRISEAGFNPVWSPDGQTVAFGSEPIEASPGNRSGISELQTVDVDSGETRVISPGDAVQPDWSPHGHRIAYWAVALGGGQRDLWTIGADGAGPVQVTNDAFLDWNPIWSPDGRFLYFVSDRSGSMNLWRVSIDEESGETLGPPEPITTPSAFVLHPSFASGGQGLVYAARTRTRNLQKMDFDPLTGTVSGEGTWLTTGSRTWSVADVSPDGTWLAIQSALGQEDLFVIRTDGTGLLQITNDPARDRRPRWAPDGTRLAFYSDRDGNYDIWTIKPDGSELRPLTATEPPVSLGFPIWSPDGSRLAVTELRTYESSLVDPVTPWEAQTPERLPPSPPSGDSGSRGYITSWSPDGRRLGGSRFPGQFVYSLADRAYRELTELGSYHTWLPDSRRIVFQTESDTLQLVDADSGDTREVFNVRPDRIGSPVLSPDGRTLYFDRGSGQGDLWLATFDEEATP